MITCYIHTKVKLISYYVFRYIIIIGAIIKYVFFYDMQVKHNSKISRLILYLNLACFQMFVNVNCIETFSARLTHTECIA